MVSDFEPAGDQPTAVATLTESIERGDRYQTLLGITGSGKSATIGWTIEQVQRPTLVLAPNKSLAAQLANEFREFFPDNRVEYFVSYYDYYQPEAYIASSDTYIEKDSSVNDEIDRLRHAATSALLTRRDVIVVASVSCIYGLGSPEEYRNNMLHLRVGTEIDQRATLRKLVDMRYERNDMNLVRGKFRVRGDTIEVHPAYDEMAVRIELFGDEIERIQVVDPLTGEQVTVLDELVVYPATHYVTGDERMREAIVRIEHELQERLALFEKEGKLLEAQRLRMRTQYDLEMMQEVGYCNGIENYSAPLDGRAPGRGAEHAARLLPRRLPAGDRREPPGGAAAPRPVRRRPGPQGPAHRARLPAPERGRQPAAAVRGGPRAGEPGGVPVGHPRALRAAGVDPGRRADRPAHRPGRPRGDREAHQGPDRRPHRADQRPHRQRRPRARHHPHQEDGRGPHRLPARAGPPRAVPPLERRHHPAHRDPPRPAPGGVRRAGGHQPAAGGPRPARRSRWWPSSTRTRRGSSAPRRR